MVGLGPIGILMVLLLRWMGIVPHGVDPVAYRRAFAAQKGCAAVFAPEDIEITESLHGVILTVCNPSTVEMAIQRVEAGGWIG